MGVALSAETAASRALISEAASPSTGMEVRGWAAKERRLLVGRWGREVAAADARARGARVAARGADAADDDEAAAAAVVVVVF